MRMIEDVLRLKLHGRLSHEAIARSVSVCKGVVAKYAALASAAGLSRWETVEPLGLADLERRLFGTLCRAAAGGPARIRPGALSAPIEF